MKKISVLVPCYNEEENIEEITNAIEEQFKKYLSNYEYEIVFIDNCSKDNTRNIIEKVAQNNNKIKAIYNIRNFGFVNSPYYRINAT